MNLSIINEMLESAKQGLLCEYGIGQDYVQGNIRVAVNRSSIRVTDLTNAGKRGKKVQQFVVYDLDYVDDQKVRTKVYNFKENLKKIRDYRRAEMLAKKLVSETEASGPGWGVPKFSQKMLRGVDVDPPEFEPIVIDTPEFHLESGYDSFTVRDKSDKFNEPCLITPVRGSERVSAAKFHKWVIKNQRRIRSMNFHQLHQAMNRDKVYSHYYCRMD